MASLPKTYIAPEEYLALDRKAEVKSEYFAGQVIAFAGASKKHNLIVANVLAGIHRQLVDRPCNVYPSDMRVRISKTGMYAYPDVVVTCGEEQFADDNNDILLTPIVLIEVLSETTASYDRGDKFEHYRRIETLREYKLVSQELHRVDQYVRQNDTQWLLTEFHSGEDKLGINSINCEQALNTLGIKFDQVLGFQQELAHNAC